MSFRGRMEFDFGVIRLSQPLTVSAVVSPILMSQEEPVNGSYCVVMGWGNIREDEVDFPPVPHQVTVSLVPKDRCSESVRQEQLCAGGMGTGYGLVTYHNNFQEFTYLWHVK